MRVRLMFLIMLLGICVNEPYDQFLSYLSLSEGYCNYLLTCLGLRFRKWFWFLAGGIELVL